MPTSLADPVTPAAPEVRHPGQPAATAACSDDLSTLAWVEGELRRSLEQCVKALRRWLRESAQRVASDVDAVDPALLRGARAPLHQAVGALELVGQPAAAEVLRAAEAALQRLAARPRGEAPAAVEAIERAAFAVLDYVARRVAGKGVGALAMFPQYAAVQALAGVERVHPCELWSRDWRWQALEPDPDAQARQPDDAARAEMEPLVLAAMRQPTPEVHARIGALCAGLAAGAQGQARTLWQLAAALYEGLAVGLIAPDVHVKRIASRLHALLRAAGRGQPEWPDRLARELLFFGLRARLPERAAATPRLAALQRAWPPDDEVRADYEHPRLGAIDPARLAQARKRVATAKEAWSAAAGGEAVAGPGVAESMALLAESVQQLFPDGDVLARALQAAAGRVAPGEAPAAALAMEVATSMLYLDAVLDDGELDAPALPDRVRRLAARVKAVAGGAAPPALEPWMEQLYRRVSDRQTMGSVVQELRASMAEAEKQIDAFFRDPSQATLLMPVPTALTSMRGVLSVLGLDEAAHAVVAMRDEVDRLLRGGAADAGAVDASCRRLADNLGALGFLIDMLGVQPHAAKALFRFDETSGRLLSSVARGPGDAGAAAPMPPRVALDAAPSQAAARVAAAEAAAAAAAAAVRAESGGIAAAASPSFGGTVPQAGAGAAAAAMPAAAVALPGAAAVPDLSDEDAEMREVFLEEAREVIAGARDSLAALAEAPDEVAELTTVRRAFHTLKGSSRMVGLAEFGDVAWACERLYNARLAGVARMDGELAAFTGEALQRLAEWIDAIAAGQPRPAASLGLAAAADALRDGRAADRPVSSLRPAPVAPAVPAAEPEAAATAGLTDAAAEAAAARELEPVPAAPEPIAEAGCEAGSEAEHGLVALPSFAAIDLGEPFPLVEAGATTEPVEVVDFIEPAESDLFAARAETVESDAFLEPVESVAPDEPATAPEPVEVAQGHARTADLPSLATMLPGLPSAADLDLTLPPPALPLDLPPMHEASSVAAAEDDEIAVPPPSGAIPLDLGRLGIELDLAALDAEELPAVVAPEEGSADAIDLRAGLLAGLGEPSNSDAEQSDAAELVLRLGDEAPPAAEPLPEAAESTRWPDIRIDVPVFEAAAGRADAVEAELSAAEPGVEAWQPGAAAAADEGAELAVPRGDEPIADEFPLSGFGLPELPVPELPVAELPEAELPEAELPEAELPLGEFALAERLEGELPEAELPEAELLATELLPAELLPAEPTAAELPRDLTPSGAAALAGWDDQAWPDIDHAGAEAAAAHPPMADEVAQVDVAAAGVESAAAGGDETDDEVRCIGALRIPIPLFNIFLAEADEQSRRLGIELAEWALEPARAVGETAIAMAHSLAGNSATVGHAELSALARQLEHALMRSHAVGRARGDEARLFVDAADEIRRLLHQFAAGFLKQAAGELVARLHGHERWPMPVDAIVDTYAAEAAAFAEAPAMPALMPGVGPGDRAEAGGAADAADEAIDDAADGSIDDAADLSVDAELFPIFEEEAEELLPQLHARLADWLRHPADRGAAAAAMRTLHTFKGGARLAGAMRLGEVAHQLESGIERLAASDDAPAAAIERLLARADGMASDFERLRLRPRAAGPAATPTEAVAAPLHAAAAAAADTHADADADADAARDGAIADDAVAALERAAGTRLVQADSDVVTPPHDAASTPPGSTPGAAAAASPAPGLRIAAASGPAIDWSRFLVEDGASSAPQTAPETAAAPAAAASVRVRAALLDRLVSEAGEVSITRARLEADARALQASLQDLTDNLERLRRQLRDLELQGETQMASRLEAAKAAAEAFDPLELDRFTRFQELTRMMAESVADVATVQRTLQRTLQSSEDELAAQARLTRALQDDLLRTRMVEFESLAERLVRVVRLAAAEAGKAARLELVGGGIEIDRGVLERMVGPFEHLLRNAVAHGIEPAAARRAAGKPETGSITVTVVQEGNEVAVELRDDGAGLDLARIRARAVERGLLAADARADDETLSSMIFEPGFSTAEAVSGLAGRGIGMDVVRAEVQAMGGRILTRSEPGRGTAFRLLLPLTTAVTQVVMLRFGSSQVALPSTLVEVVRRATPAQIEAAYASGTWADGAAPMPFFWLGALLQDDGRAQTGRRSHLVVVVRSAAQRVAVHVDEVVGQQEVVVKKLGAQLARLPGLAGVTLLPSGRVATIYNPVALAAVWGDDARRRMGLVAAGDTAAQPGPIAHGVAGASLPPVAAAASPAPAPLVLVVDDSLTVRRVTQRLLQREGYRVVLAKDGLDALDKLAGERPAVLLTDIEMPRMDGFDLVRNLRADDRLAALPVIMITSRIAQKHRDLAASLGVEHYLGKPYAEDELLALVARHAGTDVVL
ncbi:MAG: Hpt domain-containing protein [Burkholderiales bacterium]|nr:Hpt domain-containing protein [Burkholderiales bacterium]